MATLILNEYFVETLPISIDFKFNNLHLETGAGIKQTVVLWNNPILSYEITRELSNNYQDVRSELTDFYNLVKSQGDVFAYFDPIDNHVPVERGIILFRENKFNLFKRYSLENLESFRPITKPSPNHPFKFYKNNVEVPPLDYSVDYDTGQITYTNFVDGDNFTWTGNFYVPVRFDEDMLSFVRKLEFCDERDGLYSVPTFKLVEVKDVTIPLPSLPTIPPLINHEFQSLTRFNETEELVSSKILTEFDSSYESNSNNYRFTINNQPVNYLKQYQLGEYRLADQNDLNYLIDFWRCTKGGAVVFQYNGINVQGRNDLSVELNNEEDIDCGVRAVASYGNLLFQQVLNV